MITLSIPGDPVPWASHQGFGRRSFNPRFKEREAVRWHIHNQYKGKLLDDPLHVSMEFFVRIPKSFSKKDRMRIANAELYPTKRPDRSNYVKFLEDCMTGIIYQDDSLIVDGSARKLFAINHDPLTMITIMTMQEYLGFICH